MKMKIIMLPIMAVLLLGACTTNHSRLSPAVPIIPAYSALDTGAGVTSRKVRATPKDVIGVQDILDVTVFKVPELSKPGLKVDSDGNISMPLLKRVSAKGLTVEQLEDKITRQLKKYMQDPKVSITHTSAVRKRVTVEGAVVAPGIYPVVGEMTFLQAIATAKGIDEVYADVENVVVFRKEPNGMTRQYRVNLLHVRTGLSPDPMILNDDRIVVLRHPGKEQEEKILRYLPILPAIVAPFNVFNR